MRKSKRTLLTLVLLALPLSSCRDVKPSASLSTPSTPSTLSTPSASSSEKPAPVSPSSSEKEPSVSSSAPKPTLTSLEVTGTPTKRYYKEAEETFDPTGLSFVLHLSDGTSVTPAEGELSFSKMDMTGERPAVTITYEGSLGTIETIYSEGLAFNRMDRLEITTNPDKTSYAPGEAVDLKGIVLSGYWSDGTSVGIDLKDCQVSPSIVAEDTTSITISYQELDVALPITKIALKGITTDIAGGEYNLDKKFEPAGKVTLTYPDDTTRAAREDELVYKLDDRVVKRGEILKNPGTFTLDILFNNQSVFETKPTIVVHNYYLLEAEDYYESGKVPSGAENYVERTNPGAFQVNSDSDTAHGGKYLASIWTGDTIVAHFTAAEARKAAVAVCLSNSNLNAGGASSSDLKLNQTIAVKINGVDYDIGDDVLLKGTNSWSGSYDLSMWFNWQEVSFGSMDVREGDNTIEIKFIVDQTRTFDNQVAAPNIDYVKLNFENNGVPTEDAVTGLSLVQPSGLDSLQNDTTLRKLSTLVKPMVSYRSGIRNPKSLLEMACSCDGTEITSPDSLIDPGAHTIKVTYEGFSQTFDIYVQNKIRFEAETFYEKASDVPSQATTYAIRTAGGCYAVEDSGGKYLGHISYGDKMEYHFTSATAGKSAQLTIRLANGNVKSVSETEEMQLNQAISLKVNGTSVPIPDSVVLPAHQVVEGESCWTIWTELDFGRFTTIQGDNVIELEFVATLKRGIDQQVAAPNVDYLQLVF